MSARPPVRLLDVLRRPHVARTLGAALLGRLPFGALGLLLVLRVRELGGDYAAGGLVAAGFTGGLALSAPLVGRLIDRRGQTGVLVASGVANAGVLAVLAALPDGTPVGVVGALAVATGLTLPQLGGAMRALWDGLVPDPDERHAAFTLEATALEATLALGPLLVVGVVAAAWSPAGALLVCGLVALTGAVAFAGSPASRRWRPADERAAGRLGALRSPGLLVLFVAVAAMGASFGAIEVAATAFAEDEGARTDVGPVLACWAVGSLVGGLLAARAGAAPDPVRRAALLLAALAAADAALPFAPGLVGLAAVLVVAGMAVAPAFATIYGLVGGVARAGTVTESFTWLSTGVTGGIAAGAAVGGALTEAAGPRAGLGAAAAVVLVAAVAVRAGRGRLAAPPA